MTANKNVSNTTRFILFRCSSTFSSLTFCKILLRIFCSKIQIIYKKSLDFILYFSYETERFFHGYRYYLFFCHLRFFHRKCACIARSHACWFQSHCDSCVTAITFYNFAVFIKSWHIMWTDSEAFLTSNTSSLMHGYDIPILCPFKYFHRTGLHTRCVRTVLTASCNIIYQSGSLGCPLLINAWRYCISFRLIIVLVHTCHYAGQASGTKRFITYNFTYGFPPSFLNGSSMT